jgi:hypothetical protein
MQELMAEALAERGSGTAQKCEQALALAILASYLSYLTFGAHSHSRIPFSHHNDCCSCWFYHSISNADSCAAEVSEHPLHGTNYL